MASFRTALVLVLTAAAVACGSNDQRPGVLVAAASDLRFVFEEMEPQFEEQCACDLKFSFGSSGTLATQIAHGLKVDVFASADSGYVDALDDDGLLLEGTRQLYAIGRIVLAVPSPSEIIANSLDDLREPRIRRIAIANPDHAPYGRAAKQALEKTGVWEAVQSRLVLGENASLATQFVETENADAGIIPLSLAIQRERYLRFVLLDEALHQPLRQVAAVLRSSSNPEMARAFLDYINGEGRALMREYGFVLPGESVQQ
jgi:molybdate transport system substrate-binding protein